MKKAVFFALFVSLGFSASILSVTATANEAEGTAKKAADAANGQKLSATCAACHGADGNSVNPDWPKLAGQHASYIEKQLHDFRADKRADPVMSAQAKGIKSKSDIADLEAYFSSKKIKLGSGAPDKVALGEALYRGGNLTSGVAACSGCHSPDGAGNPAAKFPKIAGQQTKYVIKQLKSFKTGARSNDTGKMMRNIAIKMTDAEMEAVAEYIAGLH